MQSLFQILIDLVYYVSQAIFFLVLVQLVLSLLFQFQVLDPRQPQLRNIYFGINRLLDPLLAPIRRILPSAGGLDFSPMVLLLGLYFLQKALVTVYLNNFAGG